MRITRASLDDEAVLLNLMREAFEQENSAPVEEWAKTETAINILLSDPQAGEAYLIFDDTEESVGYIIMCRGFSIDYGGYFTWIEESHLRKAEQGRFRDQRFSP
jgi:hypothetical protein